MVLVNRRSNNADIPSVTSDDAAGVSMAMQHLVDLGHTKIVHLAGPQDLSTGVNRRRAFLSSLEELHLPTEGSRTIICDEWSEQAGAKAMRTLLDSGPEFTAVLAGNDLLALGVYDALSERGLRCPDDISVVGFNDMPFMDKVSPSMTTVRIPHYEIGAEAARLLLEVLHDPDRHPRSLLLPLTMVIRSSTGSGPQHLAPATEDALSTWSLALGGLQRDTKRWWLCFPGWLVGIRLNRNRLQDPTCSGAHNFDGVADDDDRHRRRWVRPPRTQRVGRFHRRRIRPGRRQPDLRGHRTVDRGTAGSGGGR